MTPSLTEKGADNLLTHTVYDQLALQGMPFLLARVELTLSPLWALNWRFSDIDDDYLKRAKAFDKLFLSRQRKTTGLHQGLFNPMDNAANG